MQKLGLLFAGALLLPGWASAADALRREHVALAEGAAPTVLRAKIRGRETAEYKVDVPEGARLRATLASKNLSGYFNVSAEGSSDAVFVGARDGARFLATRPGASGYTITVYLMRNAARRNETANYVLTLGLAAP